LWWVKVGYGDILDDFVTSGGWWAPISVIAATIFLVRIHPEPADACCKCFEDGVAFAGVFIGVKLGQWRSPVLLRPVPEVPNATPSIKVIQAVVKIVLGTNPLTIAIANMDAGVSLLFGWRATMKPLLHRILPPFYRLLEKARLDMPRRYFMRASYLSNSTTF